jgi:2'-5' RNA ligase
MLRKNKDYNNSAQPSDYSFGCLMLYPTNMISTYITKYAKSIIDKKDLIGDNGFENTPHITIVYGFDKKFNFNKLNKYVRTLQMPLNVNITDIDIFKCRENDKDFDVVKMTVKPIMSLTKLFNTIKNEFNVETTYNTYNPHITLAYCKSGYGKYYINKDFKLNLNLNDIVYTVNSKSYVYLPYSNTWCQF